MPEKIEVRLSEMGDRFLAAGGSPRGRDAVHRIIRTWPGWRRLNAAGRWDGAPCSLYSGPISPLSALNLYETSLQAIWQPNAKEAAQLEAGRLERVRGALEGSAPALPLVCPAQRKPMPHQLQAVWALAAMDNRALLADDMGLGKTSTALWALGLGLCMRILVICPASVKFNWKDEVKLTLGWGSLVIDGTRKDRANMFVFLRKAINPIVMQTKPYVIIINYDLLRYLTDQQADLLADWTRGQGLICDESHYLKGDSQRTRLVRQLFATECISAGAKYRLLLTGTPIRNTVEDVYTQVQCIHPQTWTSKTDFRNRHLIVVPKTVQVKEVTKTFFTVEGARDLPGLNRVLNTMMVRRKKEGVLDLPPKVRTCPQLSLADDAAIRRVYTAMKDFAVLQIDKLINEQGDDAKISIFNPVARGAVQAAMRCEQIAQGFVGGIPEPLMEALTPTFSKNAEKIPGRPNELMFPRHPKIVWLQEAVKTLILTGHRVVIYSRFLGPLRWMRSTGLVDHFLHGGCSATEKQNLISAFRNGAPSVLGCQITIAEGFNLTECQDVIFLGRDWSPAVNVQAEDRCHRIGTKGTVNIQIPIVLKTIETMIDRRLAAKEADATQALKGVTIAELRDAL